MPDEEQPTAPADRDAGVNDTERQARDSESGVDDAVSGDDDAKPGKKPDKKPDKKADTGPSGSGRVFSSYGMVSAVLGLVAVAAVVAGLVTWSSHRSDADERAYRSEVLQAAASWTSVLINLNAENVEKGMHRLRDKTVGQLNSDFDAAVGPYREVVQRIQSRSSGRIEAVAIESEHHDLDNEGAGTDNQQSPSDAHRTDPVMVIATSVAENVGGKPQTVHWALHLDVSDVDGQKLISRMKSIR
jgi:hypothetical protein